MSGKGIGTPENKERAFEVYREFGGQNIPKILSELKTRHSIKISASTFYEWKREGNWDGRIERTDAKREDIADLSFEERLLQSLISQQEQYEKYFDSLAKPDNNAQWAYAGLVKTIFDIKARMGAYKSALFLDFMKDLIGWLSRNEPEAVPVMEKVFDDFVSYAREKYGA